MKTVLLMLAAIVVAWLIFGEEEFEGEKILTVFVVLACVIILTSLKSIVA